MWSAVASGQCQGLPAAPPRQPASPRRGDHPCTHPPRGGNHPPPPRTPPRGGGTQVTQPRGPLCRHPPNGNAAAAGGRCGRALAPEPGEGSGTSAGGAEGRIPPQFPFLLLPPQLFLAPGSGHSLGRPRAAGSREEPLPVLAVAGSGTAARRGLASLWGPWVRPRLARSWQALGNATAEPAPPRGHRFLSAGTG